MEVDPYINMLLAYLLYILCLEHFVKEIFRNGGEGDKRISTYGKCLGNKCFAEEPFVCVCVWGGGGEAS
jgi:hypothetical protein